MHLRSKTAAACALLLLAGAFWSWCDNPLSVREARKHGAVMPFDRPPHSVRIFKDREAAARVLPHLQGLKRLSRIEVTGVDLTERQLRSIGKKTRITSLELVDCNIDDSDLRRLSGLTEVTFLDLARNPITDDGLQALEAMPSLCSLNLTMTKIDGPGLKVLRAFPNLRVLRVGGTEVGDEDIRYIDQPGSRLIILSIGSPDYTSKGYVELAGMLWLNDLSLPREITQIQDLTEKRRLKKELRDRFREARNQAVESAIREGRDSPRYVGYP